MTAAHSSALQCFCSTCPDVFDFSALTNHPTSTSVRTNITKDQKVQPALLNTFRLAVFSEFFKLFPFLPQEELKGPNHSSSSAQQCQTSNRSIRTCRDQSMLKFNNGFQMLLVQMHSLNTHMVLAFSQDSPQT